MTKYFLITLTAILFVTNQSMGKTNEDTGAGGHGGSYVSNEEEAHLSDLFTSDYDPNLKSEFFKRNPSVFEIVRDLGDIASTYTSQRCSTIRPDIQSESDRTQDFFNDLLFQPQDIQLVDELPCQDDPLPVDGFPQIAYGCTKMKTTYLLKSEVKKLREKGGPIMVGLAVVHERLHAFSPQLNHFEIAHFVKTLWSTWSKKQKQIAGDRTPLTPNEVTMLSHFPYLKPSGGIGTWLCDHVTQEGGGVLMPLGSSYRIKTVAPIFIGVGSSISATYIFLGDSTIMDSHLSAGDLGSINVAGSGVYNTDLNIAEIDFTNSLVISAREKHGVSLLSRNGYNSCIEAVVKSSLQHLCKKPEKEKKKEVFGRT